MTESRDRKSTPTPGKYHIQGCQKRWAIDIPHRKSRAIHILLCEKMGSFVYFYLKIEAYSYTGEVEKGGYSGGTSLLSITKRYVGLEISGDEIPLANP